MKILLTGHIRLTVIAPFYKLLKESLPHSKISVYGLNEPGSTIVSEQKKIFDEVIELPIFSKQKIKKDIFRFKWMLLIQKHQITKLIKFIILLRIKNAYSVLYEVINSNYKDNFLKKKFTEFDIINIHFLKPFFLDQIKLIEPRQKLFLSFWGSDLFQLSGVENYIAQIKALKRADIISLHHTQMEQVFLSKFGMQFKDKVRLTIFGISKKRINILNKNINSFLLQEKFKSKYKIPSQKIIIQVGYSGGTAHNHLKILKQIENLNTNVKKKIFIILPTTYNNGEKNYHIELIKFVKKSGLQILHLTDFMTINEVLMLPVISNIHINLRNSDALNNSMIEALYAGNTVIVGSWMLYGILKRKNINFIELDNINEIGNCISELIDGNDLSNKTNNKPIIEQNFLMETNIKKWCEIYKELC